MSESENPEQAGERAQAPTPKPTKQKSRKGAASRGAPAWIVPMYVVGLLLVFAGERALSALESGAMVLDALGAACVLFATVARFSSKFVVNRERESIEGLMKVLSLIGVAGLVVYTGTTDWGQEKLGLMQRELEDRERIVSVLTVIWLTLVTIATVPMLFAEASLLPMRRAERPESRRVRAAAASGLTLGLAGVYCSLFVFAADGADVKADYSYFKTSRPSESTIKIAKSLQDQIKVTAFFPEVNQVREEVEGYLNELRRSAPKLKVAMEDRLLVPKKARDLRVTQDGTVVLSKGKVNRPLVLGTEMDDARTKLKTLDRDFQELLLKLARARRSVYMTVGHGELNDGRGKAQRSGRSAKIANTLLQKQNYTVKELGIAQGLGSEVPDDADIVMVLAPSEPFASEEVKTLEKHVDRGGKLLLALDPDVVPDSNAIVPASAAGAEPSEEPSEPSPAASAAPSASVEQLEKPPADETTNEVAEEGHSEFKPLLESLSLDFSPAVLANETKHVRRSYNMSDRVMIVTSTFSSHASVSTLSRNAPRAAIVVSGAGSLKDRHDKKNTVNFAVRAPSDTFMDLNRNYRRDKDNERAESFMLAAAVTRKIGEKKSSKKEDEKEDKKKKKGEGETTDPLDDLNEARAFVVADGDAFSDLVLSNVVGNQVFFVDAVRWLGGEESWSGEQTSEEDVRIEHTKKEDQLWFYSTIFGMPALVLGAGLTSVRRARRRRRKGGKR